VFQADPGPGVPVTFPATLALAGAVFTAMLQLSLVCERWPLSGLELRWSGLVALALDRALASYADGVQWTRATPDKWITTAALSYAGAGIILHVGIGLRWPFGLKTGSPDESAPCNCPVRGVQPSSDDGGGDGQEQKASAATVRARRPEATGPRSRPASARIPAVLA
jgi:hypothetical protein